MTTELATTSNPMTSNGYINTCDMASDAGKRAVVNAMNNSLSLKDAMNVELHICNVITMPGMRKSRITGVEDAPCTNVYLIDVDGNSYFSQSDGVARDVYVISTMWPDFGKSSDLGYLALKCVEKQLSNGNTLKSLILA